MVSRLSDEEFRKRFICAFVCLPVLLSCIPLSDRDLVLTVCAHLGLSISDNFVFIFFTFPFSVRNFCALFSFSSKQAAVFSNSYVHCFNRYIFSMTIDLAFSCCLVCIVFSLSESTFVFMLNNFPQIWCCLFIARSENKIPFLRPFSPPPLLS